MTYYSDIQPTDFAGQTSSICLQTKQVGENSREVFWGKSVQLATVKQTQPLLFHFVPRVSQTGRGFKISFLYLSTLTIECLMSNVSIV